MSKKRILWLLNHTSLRNFEVPLLIDLGYEVYCPKIYQYESGDFSASVTWEYDASLTIPINVLERMNEIDFYQDIPQDVVEFLNEYFDMAMFAFFLDQLKWIVKRFHGSLLLQLFGLSNGYNYSDIMVDTLGYSMITMLKKASDLLMVGVAYDNILEQECGLFKKAGAYLPIGLKDATVKNRWVGGDRRIYFVCPRIMVNEYYHNVYENFKKDFKDYGYVIGGAQAIAVENDPSVTGFVTNKEYEHNMTKLGVMFYHSQEKRHIHYHPLEAVKIGMPLVFMAGGLLDELGGSELPGRCVNIVEARKKINRILNNDKKFIQKIVKSQEVLLHPFKDEFCRPLWIDAMEILDKRSENTTKNRKRKIGIILPAEYTGGILDYSIRVTLALQKGIEKYGDDVSLVFAHIDHPNYKEKDYFKQIRKAGIPIRSFQILLKSPSWINESLKLAGNYDKDGGMQRVIFDDGINHFSDLDYLFLTCDSINHAPLFTPIPYAVVVHDYIHRYIPEVFPYRSVASISYCSRDADMVFVTSRPTYEDAVQYGGISKNKLRLTPLMFEKVKMPSELIERPVTKNKQSKVADKYFVWSTNAAPHKNHLRAINAIAEYYRKGGELRCYITGVNTKYFDTKKKLPPDAPVSIDYVQKVRESILEKAILKNRIVFCGNMEKSDYIDTLDKAQFLFHPGYGDNGNGTVIDAAWLGVPTVCSDYPGMRYIEEFSGVSPLYFDPFESEDMADSLLVMENSVDDYKKRLPDDEKLLHTTFERTYDQLYKIVKETIGY